MRKDLIMGIAMFMFALLAYALRPDFLRSEKPDPNAPEKTLQAPFKADDEPETKAAVKTASPLDTLYQEGVVVDGVMLEGLAAPHRYHEEIGEWLVRASSEIFNIKGNDYAGHLKHLSTGMDAQALADYQSFMTSSRILETMKNNDLKIHCYVEGKPLLLNKGPVGGRYRWLFELPVTLTFLPLDAATYTKAAPVNQYILVQMQVGRVERGQGIDELMIESFSARKNPAYDKPN